MVPFSFFSTIKSKTSSEILSFDSESLLAKYSNVMVLYGFMMYSNFYLFNSNITLSWMSVYGFSKLASTTLKISLNLLNSSPLKESTSPNKAWMSWSILKLAVDS